MSADKTKINLKQPRGYAVQSRYKQAAEQFSNHSSRDMSSQDTKYKDDATGRESTAIWSDESKCSIGGKHTSTPDSQNHNILPPLDASAITDASGFLCLPRPKAAFNVKSATTRKTFQKKTKDTSIRYPIVATQSTKGMSSNSSIDREAEIDIYYAQYLQVKLLESNAKRAFHLRSKNALIKIHEVWSLINILLQENSLHQRRINFSSHLLFLYNHLSKQGDLLQPVTDTITLLEKQYKEIASAIDKVSHKLEVTDIQSPEDINQEQILSLIDKINEFLANIENCVVNRNEIIDSAAVADNLTSQAKLVTDEIKRGFTLLSESQELLLTETNLKLDYNYQV